MSERVKFEEIRIDGLVTEKSIPDPTTGKTEFTLQFSAEPPEGWRRIFETELKMGTDPHSGPVDAEIRGDRLVVPGVTVRYFEETLWPWLKTACRRTNDEYVAALAKDDRMAEAEEAHRAELDAKREKANKEIADLAERIKAEQEEEYSNADVYLLGRMGAAHKPLRMGDPLVGYYRGRGRYSLGKHALAHSTRRRCPFRLISRSRYPASPTMRNWVPGSVSKAATPSRFAM